MVFLAAQYLISPEMMVFALNGILACYLFLGSTSIGYIFLRIGFRKVELLPKEFKLGWSLVLGLSFAFIVTIFSLGFGFMNISGLSFQSFFFIFASLIFVMVVGLLHAKAIIRPQAVLSKPKLKPAKKTEQPQAIEKKPEPQKEFIFDKPKKQEEAGGTKIDASLVPSMQEKKEEKFFFRPENFSKDEMNWPESKNEVTPKEKPGEETEITRPKRFALLKNPNEEKVSRLPEKKPEPKLLGKPAKAETVSEPAKPTVQENKPPFGFGFLKNMPKKEPQAKPVPEKMKSEEQEQKFTMDKGMFKVEKPTRPLESIIPLAPKKTPNPSKPKEEAEMKTGEIEKIKSWQESLETEKQKEPPKTPLPDETPLQRLLREKREKLKSLKEGTENNE